MGNSAQSLPLLTQHSRERNMKWWFVWPWRAFKTAEAAEVVEAEASLTDMEYPPVLSSDLRTLDLNPATTRDPLHPALNHPTKGRRGRRKRRRGEVASEVLSRPL